MLHSVLFRTCFLGLVSALSAGSYASAQTAPTPAPTATPTPRQVTYSGFLRSYYFTRLNNPQLNAKNALNQAALNTAASLHLGIQVYPKLSIGGTYLYANPFNGDCNTVQSHLAGPPCVDKNVQAPNQGTNPDDTLPDFIMNTMYEAYIQYKDPSVYLRFGNQVLTEPWAPSSDSRLKPASYQGADFAYTLNKNWTVNATWVDKWESRVDSDFVDSTLLTAANMADAPGAGSYLHLQPFTRIFTPGFYYGNIGYSKGPLTANLSDYQFVNIANAVWFTGQYVLPGVSKPTLALQVGNENNTGQAVIGKINSQVFGVLGAITPWNNVTLTVGYDYIPRKSERVVLPPGATCAPGTTTISGTAPVKYFLPSGGTPQCRDNGDGTTTLYYGGWASPYTDSYATDPLYTTSISQGMADRRSPGQSVKVALTAYMYQKRLRFIASRAYYDYGEAVGGVAPTQETNLDGTFFFNAVGKGPYKGLSFRYRYADRTQNFFTNNPDFKYNRAQLEYDF